MSTIKRIIIIIIYGLITFIVALLLFQGGVTNIYDIIYGAQNHDNKTAEVTEDELLKGNGIGSLDITERLYQLSLEGNEELTLKDKRFIFERVFSSDYAYKDGCVYHEIANLYTTKNGKHELSEGIWHDVQRVDENGERGLVNIVGLLDLKSGVISGFGAQIYAFLKEHPNGSIRLDEYAIKGAIIYPIKMTFFDENNQEIKEIECQNQEDISNLPVCKEQNVWLLNENSYISAEMTLKYFEGMKMTTGRTNKYIKSISKKLDYSSNHYEKGLYHQTRSRMVNYISYTKGDYGYVRVWMISDPRISWGTGIVVFIIWTINMIVFIRYRLK